MKHNNQTYGVFKIIIPYIISIYYHSNKYSGSISSKTNKIDHRISNRLLVIKLLNKHYIYI